MRNARGFITAIALSITFAACTEDPPPALSPRDRAMIDTLYSRQVRLLRPQLDSLCDAMFAGEVQRAVDSIIKVRRAEEEQLRRRIPIRIEQ